MQWAVVCRRLWLLMLSLQDATSTFAGFAAPGHKSNMVAPWKHLKNNNWTRSQISQLGKSVLVMKTCLPVGGKRGGSAYSTPEPLWSTFLRAACYQYTRYTQEAIISVWGLFFQSSPPFSSAEMCSSWKVKLRWEIDRVNRRHEKTGSDWTSPIQWTKCIRNWFPFPRPCLLWFLFPLWCQEERLYTSRLDPPKRECNLLNAFIIITSDRKLFAITMYFLFWFL